MTETALPPISNFYSPLNLSNISKLDYIHAQKVWQEFGINSLGEYHNLYLKTDTLLLTNVFEPFKSTCNTDYGPDLAHYYTAPELARQVVLRYTTVELEVLSDAGMLLMFEHGIRGGLDQVVHHYVTTNNKYMEHSYDPNPRLVYLGYLDT